MPVDNCKPGALPIVWRRDMLADNCKPDALRIAQWRDAEQKGPAAHRRRPFAVTSPA
jgi:hypothetical protein